jgi:hypothetical protein
MMTDVCFGDEREARGGGRQAEVVFENDLGWGIGQHGIDVYGNVG